MDNNITKTKNSSGVLGFFWRYGKGQKLWMLLAFLATMLGTWANYFVPQVFRFVVDSIIGQNQNMPKLAAVFINQTAFFKLEAEKQLFFCAIFVLTLAAFAGGFNFLSRMAVSTATERFSKNLRNRLFGHIQRLPFQWQVQNQTGDIIQRCTSDLEVVHGFASLQLLEVVRTFVLIVVAFVLMFSMNITLAFISLAYIPLVGLYSIIFYSLVGKRFLAADEAEGELTVNVQENLTGVRVVRAFGREKFELDRFDKNNSAFAKLWLKLGRTLSLYWGIGDFATGMQIFTIVIVGAIMAANGKISLGAFLVFVSYNQSLAWPVRALGRVLAEMSKTGVSAQRIEEILNEEEEPQDENAKTPTLNADIHFKNVYFGYGQQPVLKGLNFTIPKASTFGILGATGSGKSTITYLLNRLYDLPKDGGDIYFGDVNIKDIRREYLRQNVGLVLQEPFLFSKTIEENIAIAAQGGAKNRENVFAAAKTAAVDKAINAFSKGYNTVVGERGVTLSGGQKQRIAIARTLMLKAPVMVFDDSLSAVDLETDARIRRGLKKEAAGATVVLISHRINTLMAADNILVLEDGKMADFGTHCQLIARPGLYQRIYEMQSKAAQDAGAKLEALGGESEEKTPPCAGQGGQK